MNKIASLMKTLLTFVEPKPKKRKQSETPDKEAKKSDKKVTSI